MDPSRIARARAHNEAFVAPAPIAPAEWAVARHRLATGLGLQREVDGLTLVRRLRDLGETVEWPNASGPDFDLEKALTTVSSALPDTVFLNWHRFDAGDVDRIATQILCRHFDDYWYPAADDIDIVDPELHWVVSIDHEGYARLVRLR